MATKGIQAKLSDGTITEVRIGGVADADKVVKKSELDLKRDLTDMAFGTAGNVSEFDATGHLEFKGTATVFEDDNIDPTNMTGGGTLPTRINIPGTTLSIAGFAGNQADEVESCKEYPHKAKLNAAGETSVVLSFHCHIYPTTADGGDVLLSLEYVFSQEGIAVPASTILTKVVTLGTTPWARQTVAFTDIIAPEALGDQFHFKFKRESTNVLDTYTGIMAVSTVGYHFEIDGGGSRLPTAK